MTQARLDERLKKRIQASGPLRVSEFMAAALTDPQEGYYIKQDPFGRSGDFITAPEVSQMFGELLGLWSAQVWMSMGAPKSVSVVELGPGRGTLQADLQRAAKQAVPDFWQAINVSLMEVSPTLRRAQQKTLQGTTANPLTWIESLGELGGGPTILIANEFLDALPIDQLVFDGNRWHERTIEVGDTGTFNFALGEPCPAPVAIGSALPGDIYERCPDAQFFIRELSAHFARHPGVALFIDYGHTESGYGDSLQAVKNHTFAPVLETPGEADLTAHVDFAALRDIALDEGASVMPLTTQGAFLQNLGIRARGEALAKTEPKKSGQIHGELERLVAPDQMGRLFKVMAIHSEELEAPPGFPARGMP